MEIPKAKKPGKYEDYQLKDAADTIQKAHEHMADPELMKALQPHLKKKIKSLADLKRVAQEKAKEAMEPQAEEKAESAKEEKAEKD